MYAFDEKIDDACFYVDRKMRYIIIYEAIFLILTPQ